MISFMNFSFPMIKIVERRGEERESERDRERERERLRVRERAGE
jgi:hypothetical protein